MISHPNQRVGIFLDAQNIYHSAKNLYKARVNFQELLKRALGDRQLVRAFAYVVKSDPKTGEDSFFEALQKSGFDLRSKDIQIYPGGAKKADWDVGLAIDAVRLAPSLDVIVLITGDGDFVPLIDYLRHGLGRQVEVMAFTRTASGKLREKSDVFMEIEKTPHALIPIGGGGRTTKRRGSNKTK